MTNTNDFEITMLTADQLTDPSTVGFENPRGKPDKKELEGLAKSIEDNGLMNPLQVWKTTAPVVEKEPVEGEDAAETEAEEPEEIYVLIGGYRRLAAIELLGTGFDEGIPCRVYTADSLIEAKYLAATDNVQRAQLTGYELAQDISRFKALGEAQNTIAAKLGKSPTWVSRKLSAFTGASPALLKAWQKGLPDDTVETLAKLEHGKQDKALEKQGEVVAKGATTEKGEKKARKAKGEARKEAREAAGKLTKPSGKILAEFIMIGEDAPKDAAYVRGVTDAMKVANGTMDPSKLGSEWKLYLKQKMDAAKEKAAASEAAEASKKNGAKKSKKAAAEVEAEAN